MSRFSFSRLRLALRAARHFVMGRKLARTAFATLLADIRALKSDERRMLRNVLAVATRRVEDVMIPRAQIVAVEEKIPRAELLAVFARAGHSRLPVYRGTLDEPAGMIHIKDLIRAEEPAGFALKSLLRDALFVPPSMPVPDLLRTMRARRIHLALVIDEHGGTCGLVSIEDLVEEIVGEIEDEHDQDPLPALAPGPDGVIEADARQPIAAAEEALGCALRLERGEEDVETLGGLVAALAGQVPERGRKIRHPSGVVIEIRAADPRRVRRVRLHLPPARRPPPARRQASDSRRS